MNSLHELNDYGDEELITTDERATILTWAAVAGYDGSTALTQTQDEGASLVMKLGYDATFMQSIPDTFVYIIDVSYAGGNVTPTWNSLPDGVTVTSAANVYTVHGISSLSQWNVVKQPSMILAANYSSNYNYDVSISYDNSSNNYFWVVQVTVSNLSEVTTTNPATLTFNQDQTLTFGAAVPNITDAEHASATYVMTLDLSDNSAGTLTSNYYSSALTTSFTSGTLTLTGSRTLINNYLNQLIFIPAPAYATSFTIAYILTSASVTLAQFSQSINVGTTHAIISNMGLNRTYYKNTAGYLFASSVPTIIETVSYTNYSVSLQFATNIGFLGLGESVSAPVGWDSGSLTYTFTGTKAQTQTVLNTLRFFSIEGQTTNSTITFRLIRDGTIIATSAILLSGTNTSVLSGGDGTQNINEDATATFSNPAVVYPHWSRAFTITFRQLNSAGSAPYAAGVLGGISGGTATSTTLTKTYTPTRYHDYATINAELAALNCNLTDTLLAAFKLQTDFSYDNSSINYTATKSITVVDLWEPTFEGSGFQSMTGSNVSSLNAWTYGDDVGTTAGRGATDYPVYFQAKANGQAGNGGTIASINVDFSDSSGNFTTLTAISTTPTVQSTDAYSLRYRFGNTGLDINGYIARNSTQSQFVNNIATATVTATTQAGRTASQTYTLRSFVNMFNYTGAQIINASGGNPSISGNIWSAQIDAPVPMSLMQFSQGGVGDTGITGKYFLKFPGPVAFSRNISPVRFPEYSLNTATGQVQPATTYTAGSIARWDQSVISITAWNAGVQIGGSWFQKPAGSHHFTTYSQTYDVSSAGVYDAVSLIPQDAVITLRLNIAIDLSYGYTGYTGPDYAPTSLPVGTTLEYGKIVWGNGIPGGSKTYTGTGSNQTYTLNWNI